MRRKKRKFVAKDKGYTAVRLLLLFGVLALIAGITVGAVLLIKNRSSFGTVKTLPFGADDPYAYTGSGFYYIKEGSLCFHDPARPEDDTSLALNGENITLVSSDSTTALFSGAALHIIGAEEMIDAGGEILAAAPGKNHTAILRRDSAGSAAILVYDAAGTLTDTISEQGDNMLLDCGFGTFEGSDMLYVLTLSSSGSIPVSTITTYTYGENGAAMSGVITLQNELVESVYFTDSSIFVAGTSNLQRYDKEFTAKAYSLLTYGDAPLDLTTGGSDPLFLYADRNDLAALSETAPVPPTVRLVSVKEADAPAAVDRSVPLPEGTHSAFVIGGKLMAFTPDTVYTYSASGSLSETAELEIPCDEARKLSDDLVLLRRGPEMRILSLR